MRSSPPRHGERHAAVEVGASRLRGRAGRSPRPARRRARRAGRSPTPRPGSPCPGAKRRALGSPRSKASTFIPCSRQCATQLEHAVLALRPELADLAPERARDGGEQQRRGLLEAVGVADRPSDAVLHLEAGGVAFARGPQPRDDHREHAADGDHGDADHVRAAAERVVGEPDRHHDGHRDERDADASGAPWRRSPRSAGRPREAQRARPSEPTATSTDRTTAMATSASGNARLSRAGVPRIQLRAQLGENTALETPVCRFQRGHTRARAEPVSADARRDEHVRRPWLGRRSGAGDPVSSRRGSARGERRH